MNFLSRLLRCLRAVPLTVALLVPLSASAFTTLGLVMDTVSALPSCLHYQVKGVCFFWKCSWKGCWIRTSIRVKHYLPEAVVSTYADPLDHPWMEIGMPMSTIAKEVGSLITTTVLPSGILGLDADAETADTEALPAAQVRKVNFKSADAYGNPAAHISDLMAGRLPPISGFTLPGFTEISAWARNVLPNTIRSIRAAGGEFRGVVAQGLSHLAKTPAELADYLDKIPAILGKIPSVFNSLGGVGGAFSRITAIPGQVWSNLQNIGGAIASGNFSLGTVGNMISNLPNQLGDIGTALVNHLFPGLGELNEGLQTLQELGIGLDMFTEGLNPFSGIDLSLAGVDLSILGDIMDITGGLFCPASSIPFSPHFISDMDGITWRNLLPLEMLDARSWVPLTSEVSTNPLSFPVGHTWGSVYPRIGELVQQHPVKASAVYAERVHSIISQKQQPHIYTALEPRSGWKYFGWGGEARWQRLHPKPNSSCIKFGANNNFGDSGLLDVLTGNALTTSDNAYSWNMWMQHDCCKSRGKYLFHLP